MKGLMAGGYSTGTGLPDVVVTSSYQQVYGMSYCDWYSMFGCNIGMPIGGAGGVGMQLAVLGAVQLLLLLGML